MNASASLIFVKFFIGTSKTGKPFQMLEMSDGLKSKTFFTRFGEDLIDYCSKLDRGEKITVQFKVDPFEERDMLVVTDLEAA